MFFRFLFLICISCISLSVSAGQGFIVESMGKGSLIEPRKKLIEQILSKDSLQFGYNALSIIIDASQTEPRGKMTGKKITLSSTILKESEFVQLLLHEIGHYVDIYMLINTAYHDDSSSQFYTISWKNKNTKKPNETIQSFISWYAATNQYEDFAESFTFYMFHNREFADRALRNESLRQKYIFFAENVFMQGEFSDTDFRTGNIPSYFWDTTKIPISVKKYLYSLK